MSNDVVKSVIAGKNSNIVGNKDSSLILRGTSIKYQFGNKFIDIIKNGKINIEENKILKIVSSENEMNQDGIYLIDKNIWIKIGQNSIKLQNIDNSEVYVSFLKEQKVTAEQKQIALSNIGFYYNTIQEVQNANIKSGIVYILGDNKLYIVNNGELKEYVTTSSSNSSINNTIIDNNQNLYIKGNSLYVGNIEYANCYDDKISLLKRLVLHNGLQSNNANINYGFRLFMQDGLSILEVDKIVERTRKEDQTQYEHIPIYSQSNNIISSQTTESEKTICTLKYQNIYNVGDVITLSNNITTIDCVVENISENNITISNQDNLNFVGYYTFLLTKPYIRIQDNKLLVKDNDINHTVIGPIKEEDFPELNSCSEIESNVGIYSDNIISIGAKMYDTVFKYRCDYPKYDNLVTIPENNMQDSQYNQVVPNIFWIKQLIDMAIPKGTITMWSGDNIPDGWSICDGTNGTPNLVGRFIKAVGNAENVGEIETDLNDNGELVLTQEYLPKHSHNYTITGEVNTTIEPSEELSLNLVKDDYNYGLTTDTKTIVSSVSGLEGLVTETEDINQVVNYDIQGGTANGGIHTHIINSELVNMSISDIVDDEEQVSNNEWPNKPIKIEPRSYALIFIMKTKNFNDK